MRSERPIHLDVGVPSGNAFGKPADTHGESDARSQQELADQGRNLRELLAQQRQAAAEGDAAATAAPAAPAETAAHAPSVASPFDLFQATAPSLTPAPAPAAVSATLAQALEQMASRLLVGDGRQGRRGVQLSLSDAHWPGVVVDVFEESARLVARFTCRDEDPRERLCAGARWFAESLAQRLQRDTRVEVQTDDPEDSCLLQVDADR